MNVAHAQQAWQLTFDDHSYPHEQQLQHKRSPCIFSADIPKIYMRVCTTIMNVGHLVQNTNLIK